MFKDRINKTAYSAQIAELSQAIEKGDNALKRLLLDTENTDLYENHGKYKECQHNKCGGLGSNTFDEKRLCKCLYYFNGQFRRQEECNNCLYKG